MSSADIRDPVDRQARIDAAEFLGDALRVDRRWRSSPSDRDVRAHPLALDSAATQPGNALG